MSKVFILLTVVLFSTQARAVAPVAQSGVEKVPLLELYSSEGCSSCPPADQWFTALENKAGLWQKFVPIAFHVTYWDYLGWKDRFAAPKFTKRQRHYANIWQARTVYTPAVVFDGADWKWRTKAIPSSSKNKQVGKLSISKVENGAYRVQFLSREKKQKLTLNLALLGFGIKHWVKAGENAGKKLRHDFIVLAHDAKTSTGKGNQFQANFKLKASFEKYQKLALVAWASELNRPHAIQATGGFLK